MLNGIRGALVVIGGLVVLGGIGYGVLSVAAETMSDAPSQGDNPFVGPGIVVGAGLALAAIGWAI